MERTLTLVNTAHQLSWLIAARESRDFYKCRDTARFLFQGSRAVKHKPVVEFLQETFSQNLFHQVNNSSNLNNFVSSFVPWIQSHPTSKLEGLSGFQVDYSAGTTQSFDSFYYRHRHRRMRCLVGEYFYHLKTWISNRTSWSFLSDDDPLSGNDALVISLPFCDTGDKHEHFDELLEQCSKLKIPVLVDCCYFPISAGIHADLSAACIDTVAFSLSKAFPIANLRIGVRFTKQGIFDGQRLHDSINYNNSLSAWVGNKLITEFPPDYIHTVYADKQQEVCSFFELKNSRSVLFASGSTAWSCFSRKNLLDVYQLSFNDADFSNRISLVSIYDNWDLFTLIQNELRN